MREKQHLYKWKMRSIFDVGTIIVFLFEEN